MEGEHDDLLDPLLWLPAKRVPAKVTLRCPCHSPPRMPSHVTNPSQLLSSLAPVVETPTRPHILLAPASIRRRYSSNPSPMGCKATVPF